VATLLLSVYTPENDVACAADQFAATRGFRSVSGFVVRGNWKLGRYNSLASRDEITAYSIELQLLTEAGGADAEYLDYLHRQIDYYRRLPEALKNM
jgi:hypothetical protein